jgi:F-type H+-transporting ATPase subunit a
MGEIGKIIQLHFTLMGMNITLNIKTLLMSWLIMSALILFSFLAASKIKLVPGVFQSLAETIVSVFDKLVIDTLESKDRKYFPFITALFLFLLLCNYIGVIPGCEEPTKDLNTPLGLAILGFLIAHYSGIKSKGIIKYSKEYLEPFFIMAPLNLIGELAKVISISFRLFGNIMGGSIIIIVVSHLVYNLVLPPFLYAFFGIFVGTVQAFVFTMLSLVYIALQIKE